MDSAEEKGRQEITAYLDRVEELEDGTATAVFYVEDDEDDFRQFTLPADFLPEDAGEGEYFTLTIARAADKTQAALNDARNQLETTEE